MVPFFIFENTTDNTLIPIYFTMHIRKATIKDLDQLAVLFDQYRMFYEQASDKKSAESFLRHRMEKEESVILVAEENSQLAGFTQLYPIFSSVSMQRTWLLNDLYVAKSYRNNGIATSLLAAAKIFAKETSSKWLLLQTAIDNTTAQRVYVKNGWRKETDIFYRLDV
jgi:GNAT superfamily N-acetyltransferase